MIVFEYFAPQPHSEVGQRLPVSPGTMEHIGETQGNVGCADPRCQAALQTEQRTRPDPTHRMVKMLRRTQKTVRFLMPCTRDQRTLPREYGLQFTEHR